MAVFAISFRIEDSGDRYARWKSLVDAVRAEASGAAWEETTSFFIIESDRGSASDVAHSLVMNSDFDLTLDVLLVINLSNKSDYSSRNVGYPIILESLMTKR